MPRSKSPLGEGAVHRFDDVTAHAEVAQGAFGLEPDHPLAGASRGRQTHGFQMLEAANHEAADFRVRGTWMRGAEIDGAGIIRGHADFGVEPGPSFGADIALKGRADFVLRLRAEFDRDKFLGPRAQAAADVVAGDHEVPAGLVDAAHQQVDMRIVGVPVIDGDPIEPGPKIGLHLPREVAGEGAEIGHLGGVFGRDDEAEMVAVVGRPIGEGCVIGAIVFGIEHPRLLAVESDALALQIGDVRRQRRGAESTPRVTGDARLHHDAARGREQAVAAERDPAAPESRTAQTASASRRRLAMQRGRLSWLRAAPG